METLSNDTLMNHLEHFGLGDVRQDKPFADATTKTLWDKAMAAQHVADEAMLSLREHLKLSPPRKGFYCGCCEAWHGGES